MITMPSKGAHSAWRVAPCVICGAARTPFDAQQGHTCSDLQCRWRYESIPASQRCRVCRRPLDARAQASGVCDDQRCVQAGILEPQWEFRRAQVRAATEWATRWRDAASAADGLGDGDSYPVVLVPVLVRRQRRVPANRRAKLAARIRTLAEWATSPSPPPDALPEASGRPREVASVTGEPRDGSPNDEPVPGSGTSRTWRDTGVSLVAACAACRGQCCTNGAEHAYLTMANVRAWLDAHPGAGVEDAVTAYTAHAPATSAAGSCIYHGPRGCNLPREMRSDICNGYLCWDLRAFLRNRVRDERPRAFFAAVEGATVYRGAFMDGELVHLARGRTKRTT